MPYRIGVISDTHITDPRQSLIPAPVLEAFQDVSYILHAGDIACKEVLEELRTFAPVYAVFGNVDPPSLAANLSEVQVLFIADMRIGITHGHLGKGRTAPERAASRFSGDTVQAIVFGHSHEPYNQVQNGVLLFNPGSPTDRRRQPRPSYGILTVDEANISGEIIRL